MKSIGIFLAYAPEQSLAEHGLGRLLAMLVRGMVDRDVRVVLATPHWSAAMVHEVLRDFGVDPEDVDWVVTRADPVLLRLRRAVARRRRRTDRRPFGDMLARARRSAQRNIRVAAKRLGRGFTTSSVPLFIATALTVTAVPLALLALVAWRWPVFLGLLAVLALLAWIARMLSRRWLAKPIASARGWLRRVRTPLREFKGDAIAQRLYGIMRQQELEGLLRLVNARADVEGWLVPTLFWPEAAGIRAPKTVVVPDLVMVESPVHYARYVSMHTFEQLCSTIRYADHLICYSEHVKRTHLVRRFGIDPKHVSVIEHAPVDLLRTFSEPPYQAMPVAQAARDILRRHVDGARGPVREHLRGVDLARVPFLFYASQIRLHKNILMLVRAYEQLLRRDLVNVKLVLTGDLFGGESERLRRYIRERHLQYDVLSLPRVPADVLAALFSLARLAVCPTLFEGGLPFTFSEALSVGTPVVMSRIPVVAERITDPQLAAAMLFDPYDEDDMCARMRWGLGHRDELLAMQRKLYAELAGRSWAQVAGDYVTAMTAAREARAA